jgi:hypothetical protein
VKNTTTVLLPTFPTIPINAMHSHANKNKNDWIEVSFRSGKTTQNEADTPQKGNSGSKILPLPLDTGLH